MACCAACEKRRTPIGMPPMRPGGCGCLAPGGASAAAWYDQHREVWENPALAALLGPLPAITASVMRGDRVDEITRQTACAYARMLPVTIGLGGTIAATGAAGAAIGTAVSGLGGIPFGAIAAASATISAVAAALLPLAQAVCDRRQFSSTDAARAAAVAAKEGPAMASGDFSAAAAAAARIAGAAAPTLGAAASGRGGAQAAARNAAIERAREAQRGAKARATAAARATAIDAAKDHAVQEAARRAAVERGCQPTGPCPSVDLCGEIWASPRVATELAACRAGSPQTAQPPVPRKGGGGVAILAALAALQALR